MVWMIGPWDPCEGRGGSWKLVRFSKFQLCWNWEGKLTWEMPSIYPCDELRLGALPWDFPMGEFTKCTFFAHFWLFPIILKQNIIFQMILLVIMALCCRVGHPSRSQNNSKIHSDMQFLMKNFVVTSILRPEVAYQSARGIFNLANALLYGPLQKDNCELVNLGNCGCAGKDSFDRLVKLIKNQGWIYLCS